MKSREPGMVDSSMSHDMRTPLNVIIGITDLLLDEEKPFDEAKVRNDLLKIKGAGELLLGVVNDILDVSRIETQKLELNNSVYNTANILNDIITLNRIRLDSNPVKFSAEVNDQMPCELRGDAQRIKQIINRLLSFAFRNTKYGPVSLSMDFKPADQKSIFLIAAISGSDAGIIPDNLTKKLVEMMQGEIIFDSQERNGTSFKVHLKQDLINDKIIGKESAEKICNFEKIENIRGLYKKTEYRNLSDRTVLVVDDFLTNLEISAGILRKYKMKVDCVDSGKKAIKLIEDKEPVYDAVFMDHMMPEMDGIEAAKYIRGLDSEYAQKIPIIALTANISPESEQLYTENGFNAFLSKPIIIQELELVLNNCLPEKSEPDPFAREIPGIKIKIVIDLMDGDKTLSIFAFRSFCNNAPNTVERIRNVSAENLGDYAIAIHSLKSMSATIGAEDLSAKAKNLETLSRAGNLAGVLALNAEFISDLEELLRNLKLWLQEAGK